jgi:hypothetical protein
VALVFRVSSTNYNEGRHLAWRWCLGFRVSGLGLTGFGFRQGLGVSGFGVSGFGIAASLLFVLFGSCLCVPVCRMPLAPVCLCVPPAYLSYLPLSPVCRLPLSPVCRLPLAFPVCLSPASLLPLSPVCRLPLCLSNVCRLPLRPCCPSTRCLLLAILSCFPLSGA